jgi:hypothetical protein
MAYEDTFDEYGPEWGEPDEVMYVDEGVMVLKPEPGWALLPLNQGVLLDDGEISVRSRQVEGKYQDMGVGLIFWAESKDDCYVFVITRSGTLSVIRFAGEKVLFPVEWRQSDAIKKGLDTWNEVKVVTQANKATIFVNGAEIVTVKGQPPAGGGYVGLYAAAPDNEAITYEFDDLKVK